MKSYRLPFVKWSKLSVLTITTVLTATSGLVTPPTAADFGLTPVSQSQSSRPGTHQTCWVFSSWINVGLAWNPSVAMAQDSDEVKDETPELNSGLLSAFKARGIGPALMSGRIVDIAIDPVSSSTWYIAAAAGGVWKTENSGVTWNPIFDNQSVYSIGCVTVDPKNRFNVWVGTGENNSQRSVGYGDGLYKSVDAGKTFQRVGLENSEHIAKVIVDPHDSETVFVASQGPLWKEGGDRGVYKTTDGGKTWENVLTISENTGVTDLLMDPRDSNTLYAASYQRRRHVWTLVDGGPESTIYKTTDGGRSWKKINRGLPGGDLGRIGLAISPIQPDVVYAIVEATGNSGGFYRSEDRGESWQKQGSYVSGSPQYYQEIFCDPNIMDRIYSMDTMMMVSNDGGKNFAAVGEADKHVDNHALVIDPKDSNHLLVGCDGGLYESWDQGKTYRYFTNLPLTQFYKIAVSNDEPFYYIYGGTQDNATQGAPTRTNNVHGIRNSDWFITVFGDGFDPVVDPDNPDIIYSQWQYGGLVRYDRKSGEQIDIKPQPQADGPALRFNWDSGIAISPHASNRIYYAAQMLFQSDDQGDTWKAISPDLTRQIDRNTLKVMDRVWGIDSVAKNTSTSFYGSIVAVTESPLVEGLIYVGTDDGLIQVTEDGGENWRKIEKFGSLEVPEFAYVSDIEADLHDENTVYVVVQNFKRGDFKPYILKSADRGQTWEILSQSLPEKGSTYTIAQDHENANLMFCGTEFGLFATLDGGQKWIPMKSGLPTVAVRDLEVQRRENDLAIGTFGRGMFIVDDYSPMRHLNPELLKEKAKVLPVKPGLMYVEVSPLGVGGKAFQGADFYTAPNPEFGVTFTYFLKDSLTTQKSTRTQRERQLASAQKDVPYPTWEELRTEGQEESPQVFLTIRDADGQLVNRLPGSTSAGLHRTTWNYRYQGSGSGRGMAPAALPGTYQVWVETLIAGKLESLTEGEAFQITPIGWNTLPDVDKAEVLAFQRQTLKMMNAVQAASAVLDEASQRVETIKSVAQLLPEMDLKLRQDARDLELKLQAISDLLNGDSLKPSYQEPELPGLSGRLQSIVRGHWNASHGPTGTHRQQFEVASEQLTQILKQLRPIVEKQIPALNKRLEKADAPWTPGRSLPKWND